MVEILMGIGDSPLPVASTVEANNPVPDTGDDGLKKMQARVTVDERSSRAELVRQIRYLYDVLSEPYPPP